MNRKTFLKRSGMLTAGLFVLSQEGFAKKIINMESIIKQAYPLGTQWKTQDPFMFCAHHLDLYPGGNENFGPRESLEGRNIGSDFAGKDGWNMYHGTSVPGFPAHPHCGFETVTIVTKGFADHSDSLGGKGRFGKGDAQWLTAGKGVQHSEMFPLLDEEENTLELFQLWLNLPSKSKKVDPCYQMFWHEDIPVFTEMDQNENESEVHLIAGSFGRKNALKPNPDSWAADPINEVMIIRIEMNPNASLTIPKSNGKVNRSIYFYDGEGKIELGNREFSSSTGIDVDSLSDLLIQNHSKKSYIMILQGKPIGEPVVQHGPFVANSAEEINASIQEYQQTHFGGWPYETSGPVHGNAKGRFAKYSDGSIEKR